MFQNNMQPDKKNLLKELIQNVIRTGREGPKSFEDQTRLPAKFILMFLLVSSE